MDIVGVKRGGSLRGRCLERPDLPFLILVGEIGDAGIIRRPKGLANVAVKQIAGAARVEFVEDNGGLWTGFRVHVDVEEFLAVVGKREVCAGGGSLFLHYASD